MRESLGCFIFLSPLRRTGLRRKTKAYPKDPPSSPSLGSLPTVSSKIQSPLTLLGDFPSPLGQCWSLWSLAFLGLCLYWGFWLAAHTCPSWSLMLGRGLRPYIAEFSIEFSFLYVFYGHSLIPGQRSALCRGSWVHEAETALGSGISKPSFWKKRHLHRH